MRRVFCVAPLLALLACGGGDDPSTAQPLVDLIPEAIAAVEAHYGAPQQYFEISAGLESVGLIVAVDGATAAEQGSYGADGTFVPPVDVGEASGSTFRADVIDFDPDRIFDSLRDELDDPVIVDFAIQGGPDGVPIYDATVASEEGGVLLVLLAPDGAIQGVQGQ